MRKARAALALLLAFAVPVRAETTADPLWYLLSTYVLAPDAKAVEAQGDGPADSKGLAALQADLLVLTDGFEGFRDEAQVKETLERLKPRMSPELRPFFKDRASSLDAIYRTLAVTDYTWAQRFPEPPCEPIEARRKVLASRDGLFQTEKGEPSPWLLALLGPQAEGKSAEQALDQASSQAKLTGAEYEKLRARVRKLTMALASDKAVGASRSKLYCSRAAAFTDLAAAQRVKDAALISAARVVTRKPEESVFVVVWKNQRAAATLLSTKNGPALVTDAAIVAETDHPNLFAYSANAKPVQLAATVARRHPELSVAVLTVAEDPARPALSLAETTPAKDELVTAIGHTMISGLWTKTSGLVTKVGEISFQTDAAISPELSGAPVLNEVGQVAGMLVLRPADTEEGRWPVAIPAPVLVRWLDDPAFSFPAAQAEAIEDGGTAAVLTRARPIELTKAGLGAWNIPNLPPPPSVPHGVCVQNCGGGSSSGSSYSGGYSGSGGEELGKALGELGAVLILKGIPALFRGIGKLFKGSGKSGTSPNPSSSIPKQSAPAKQELPSTPKERPALIGLEITLTPDELLEGEHLIAVATLRFKGENPPKSNIKVAYSTDRGTTTYSAKTNAAGIASVTIPIEGKEYEHHKRSFDDLAREELRHQGIETPSFLTPNREPKTNSEKIKQRAPAAFEALEREEANVDAPKDPEEEALASPDDTPESTVSTDWSDTASDGLTQAGANAGFLQSNPGGASPRIPQDAFSANGATESSNDDTNPPKLYSVVIKVMADAGSMGSAVNSKSAAVLSNKCPPGTMANPDPADVGQPGNPAMGSAEKLALDADCRELESAAEMSCVHSPVAACKNAVLRLLHYDFRACLNRWEPDGDGTPGSLGNPTPPKPDSTTKRRRCISREDAKSLTLSAPGSYAKGLGKGRKRPAPRGARLAFRALMRALLSGADFLKNETHAIFQKIGDYASASAEFEKLRAGGKPPEYPGVGNSAM